MGLQILVFFSHWIEDFVVVEEECSWVEQNVSQRISNGETSKFRSCTHFARLSQSGMTLALWRKLHQPYCGKQNHFLAYLHQSLFLKHKSVIDQISILLVPFVDHISEKVKRNDIPIQCSCTCKCQK